MLMLRVLDPCSYRHVTNVHHCAHGAHPQCAMARFANDPYVLITYANFLIEVGAPLAWLVGALRAVLNHVKAAQTSQPLSNRRATGMQPWPCWRPSVR